MRYRFISVSLILLLLSGCASVRNGGWLDPYMPTRNNNNFTVSGYNIKPVERRQVVEPERLRLNSAGDIPLYIPPGTSGNQNWGFADVLPVTSDPDFVWPDSVNLGGLVSSVRGDVLQRVPADATNSGGGELGWRIDETAPGVGWSSKREEVVARAAQWANGDNGKVGYSMYYVSPSNEYDIWVPNDWYGNRKDTYPHNHGDIISTLESYSGNKSLINAGAKWIPRNYRGLWSQRDSLIATSAPKLVDPITWFACADFVLRVFSDSQVGGLPTFGNVGAIIGYHSSGTPNTPENPIRGGNGVWVASNQALPGDIAIMYPSRSNGRIDGFSHAAIFAGWVSDVGGRIMIYDVTTNPTRGSPYVHEVRGQYRSIGDSRMDGWGLGVEHSILSGNDYFVYTALNRHDAYYRDHSSDDVFFFRLNGLN